MDQCARALLEAVARGDEGLEGAIEALVVAVLGDELVRLALQAAAGGPHQLRRALELAAAVVARQRNPQANHGSR